MRMLDKLQIKATSEGFNNYRLVYLENNTWCLLVFHDKKTAKNYTIVPYHEHLHIYLEEGVEDLLGITAHKEFELRNYTRAANLIIKLQPISKEEARLLIQYFNLK